MADEHLPLIGATGLTPHEELIIKSGGNLSKVHRHYRRRGFLEQIRAALHGDFSPVVRTSAYHMKRCRNRPKR